MRSTPIEIMRKRQQCHDLRAQGKSQREIQAVVNAGRATVRDWLNRCRPTEEDIIEAKPANASVSPVETLQRWQRCHDMHAAGASYADLQGALNVSVVTVKSWLTRPRPTDEEVEAARDTSAKPKTDITGQVGFKSRFDPELFAELRAEADAQGAATNRVIGCAVRLYLDVMARARAGGGDPVQVLGYRA